jgi:hypothetical protein
MEVYAIKVTLLGTSPPVWRRILVPRDITLGNLHRTLQTVMGVDKLPPSSIWSSETKYDD